MKKVCVFLMFVLVVYGGVSSYATTDIAADAESSECVEDITGTYSGDANFKAKWTPNNIQLNWYNNNTLIQGVNTESNTCNYGMTLTIPTTPPERTGYIFDGWKVRPKMDFSTLTSLQNSSESWDRNNNGGHHGYTGISRNDSNLSDLEAYEWKVQFNSGTIKGTLYGSARLSTRSGNYASGLWNTPSSFATTEELESATGEQQWCWCQATGWKPENSDIIYANSHNISYGDISVPSNIAWVIKPEWLDIDLCAQRCAALARSNSYFRRALFVGDGNNQ